MTPAKYLIKEIKLFLLFCTIFIVVATVTTRAVEQSSALSGLARPQDILFHHHIHNFHFNVTDTTKSNYLAMQRHAIAMSYDAVTHYIEKKLPGNLDSLNRILLHNAYYLPLNVDFNNHEVKYSASYQALSKLSPLNPKRVVWNSYPIDSDDIEIIKGYSCAKSGSYKLFSGRTSYAEASDWFQIDKDYKRIIANWQSKYVVDQLSKYTIQSLNTNRYDFLFIDDIPRNVDDCVNKAFGGQGYYDSWKAGQLAFLQKVTAGARKIHGYHGKPFKVFGNIWSPYADSKTAKWYADGLLRLDHYYFESGGYAREDVINGQAANSLDPETGLPAFKPLFGGGYIPANLVSLGTHIETMYALTKPSAKPQLFVDYLNQHYMTAGTAATQGSWFGWYGETSVDKLDAQGKLIHTNEMQLLRVIPNWDNLAGISLNQRQYNISKNQYTSPNSQFNYLITQSRNPINNELYVVYKSISVELDLVDKSILSANFVDDYFNKTSVDALSCLSISNGKAKLVCAEQLNRGIRIVTN
jgi:hypothetical protein